MNNEETKNIVITGATDGIGKAAALRLAEGGARLVLLGRNPDRCRGVVDEIVRETGNERVDSLVADLSSLRGIRQATEQIRATCDRVDVLIHSAGGTFPEQRQETEDGLELTFVVQYLARFCLTEGLLDLLRSAPEPRVISLAGGGTWSKGLDLDDLQSEKGYGSFAAIGKASATNELLTMEQASRHEGIRFYNCGPGLVRTKTLMSAPVMALWFGTVGRLFSRTPEQAGADVARLATGDHAAGYYGAGLKENTPTWARANAASAAALWDRSEALVTGH